MQSLTLKTEHWGVWEQGISVFGPKREEVAGGWRRPHNEKLHNFYDSPNIIRVIISKRMKWAWHVARMGQMRNAYKILVEKTVGKSTRKIPT
jgi:hypothetical protein